MSILNSAVEELRKETGLNISQNVAKVLIEVDRLKGLLDSPRPLKREDKDILHLALSVLQMLSEN